MTTDKVVPHPVIVRNIKKRIFNLAVVSVSNKEEPTPHLVLFAK